MKNDYRHLQQVLLDKIKRSPNIYGALTSLGVEKNYGRALDPQIVKNIRQTLASFEEHNRGKNQYFREKKEAENESFIFFEHNNNPSGRLGSKDLKTRIYIPISENANNDEVVTKCFKELNKLGFNYTGKLSKVYRNDSLMFEFDSKQEARKFAQSIYPQIQSSLGVHNPFIKDYHGLGVLDFTFDPTKESYTSILSEYLEKYQSYCVRNDKEFSPRELRQFIKDKRGAESARAETCDYIISSIDEPEIEKFTSQANNGVQTAKEQYVPASSLSDPLEKCKADFEKYALVSTKNGFEVKNRKTGKIIQPSSEFTAENIDDLKATLGFMKLFMDAHDKTISHSFTKTKNGYDEQVYNRAVSNEGKYTLAALVSTMRNIVYNGNELSGQKIIDGVKDNFSEFSSSGRVVHEMFSAFSQGKQNALNAGKLQEYENLQKLAKNFLADVGNNPKFASIKAPSKDND